MKRPNFLVNKASMMMLLAATTMVGLTGCGSSGGGSTTNNGNSGTTPNTQTATAPETGIAGDGRLQEIVDYIRQDNSLPALAAVMVHDGQVIEMSATGLRSVNATNAVTVDDKWHLGSLTKSMTSTLAAKLVQQGTLEWNTTIGEVFPELLGVMRSEYESVRLDELLSHTAGFMANIPNLNDYHNNSTDIRDQRYQMIEQALVRAPEKNKGEFLYSNLGYMIAGAMMERLTGNSWETLISNNVFDTLAMSDTGFGAPDVESNLSQPVGHSVQGSGWNPVTSGITDNAPVLGPAGTVHGSLEDMGKYIAAHLAGARGNDVNGLLSAAEFTKLHTPLAVSSYALGWGVAGNSLQHNGSNTMWLATISIDPDKNLALFIATNAADLSSQNSKAIKATNQLISQLTIRADGAFRL